MSMQAPEMLVVLLHNLSQCLGGEGSPGFQTSKLGVGGFRMLVECSLRCPLPLPVCNTDLFREDFHKPLCKAVLLLIRHLERLLEATIREGRDAGRDRVEPSVIGFAELHFSAREAVRPT